MLVAEIKYRSREGRGLSARWSPLPSLQERCSQQRSRQALLPPALVPSVWDTPEGSSGSRGPSRCSPSNCSEERSASFALARPAPCRALLARRIFGGFCRHCCVCPTAGRVTSVAETDGSAKSCSCRRSEGPRSALRELPLPAAAGGAAVLLPGPLPISISPPTACERNAQQVFKASTYFTPVIKELLENDFVESQNHSVVGLEGI